MSLPQLRRTRRVDVPRYVGKLYRPVADIDSQVEPYAQAWDQHNADAMTAEGPLWVVLGDSSSQGIGASLWSGSWVMSVLDRLRSATGENWRVVNLSMSGARFRDAIDLQIPVMHQHVPNAELVTAVVGSNDMMWRLGIDDILRDARELVAALPVPTVLSLVGEHGRRRQRTNQALTERATAAGHHLFSIWRWPSATGALAADKIHPSDTGYQHMADLAWSAVGDRLALA